MLVAVSDQCLGNLRSLAIDHLYNNNILACVKPVGSDEWGNGLYAIVFKWDDQEKWFGDQSDNTCFVWTSLEDAKTDLDSYVLPNMGFSIQRNQVKQFLMNL